MHCGFPVLRHRTSIRHIRLLDKDVVPRRSALQVSPVPEVRERWSVSFEHRPHNLKQVRNPMRILLLTFILLEY